MKVAIKSILILLLVLAFAIALGVFWLSKTESGLRWGLARAESFVSVDSIQGQLSDFSFSGMEIKLPSHRISIASGQGKWQPWLLFSKTLVLDQLGLSDVQVFVDPTELDPQPYQPWQGINVPINVQINAAQISGLKVQSGEQTLYEFERASLGATLESNVLDIAELSIIAPTNQQNVQGQIDLTAQAQGRVDLQNRFVFQSDTNDLLVSGEIEGVWQDLMVRQLIESDITANINLSLEDLLSERLRWSGEITTAATSLPLNLAQTINLEEGRFDTRGEFSPSEGLSTLTVILNGELNGGNDVASFWNMQTDLSYQGDVLEVASLRLIEQQAQRQGELSFSGEIVGVTDFIQQTESNTAQANLTGQWQSLGWPFAQDQQIVRSDGQFSFTGVPTDFSLVANAEGRTYEKPFSLDLDLDMVDQTIIVNQAQVESGQSVAAINGRAASNGASLAFNWEIDSLDIADLLPMLSGDLKSSGQLSGSLNEPVVSLSASSQTLNYFDYSLENALVDLSGRWGAQAKQLSGVANIAQISQKERVLVDAVKLDIQQVDDLSQIQLDGHLLERSQLKLLANLSQAVDGTLIELRELTLADPEYDIWSLRSPVGIRQQSDSTERAWIWQDACLQNNDQAICVDAVIGTATKNLQGSIDNLALSGFNPLLEFYQVSVGGRADATFSYQVASGNATPQIDTLVEFKNIELTLPQNSSTPRQRNSRQLSVPQSVSITSGILVIKQKSSFLSELKLDLENDDRIDGQLEIAALIGAEDFSTAELNAALAIDIDNLSNWPISGDFLSGLDGQLNANIDVSGNLSNPNVAMQTRLVNAKAQIPQLGIDLVDISIEAISQVDRNILVTGELSSGEGRLKVDGRLDFAQLNQPRVNASLRGENLTFMQTKEFFVVGDIDTEVEMLPQLLTLEGTINLDEADIDFAIPEGAVVASKDVIFVGEEQYKSTPQKINLNIDLGDETAIRALGLEGFLGGRLTLLQDPGGLLRGRGRIDINQGEYKAYGQNFDIDRGQLFFNNGEIDNPSLDINAQKEVDSTEVGVNVSGTAQAPILNLYSTPSMPDEDILSVLIFGKRLEDIGSGDGLTLLKIADSMRGGGESNITAMTNNIQDTFGLSELELAVDDGSPTLRAGKQFSSQFYVGYGYGLLDAAQSLILRYKINQAWSIQGDVGADSGADIRYQIQR